MIKKLGKKCVLCQKYKYEHREIALFCVGNFRESWYHSYAAKSAEVNWVRVVREMDKPDYNGCYDHLKLPKQYEASEKCLWCRKFEFEHSVSGYCNSMDEYDCVGAFGFTDFWKPKYTIKLSEEDRAHIAGAKSDPEYSGFYDHIT